LVGKDRERRRGDTAARKEERAGRTYNYTEKGRPREGQASKYRARWAEEKKHARGAEYMEIGGPDGVWRTSGFLRRTASGDLNRSTRKEKSPRKPLCTGAWARKKSS